MPADVALHEHLEATEQGLRLASSLDLLAQRAVAVLAAVDAADAELSVVLCGDRTIRTLNAEWRDTDTPTDVISFPQGDAPPGAPRHLGDVVISVDTAQRQADELGHPLDDELGVLLTHGVLHLLGHEHHASDDRAVMLEEEARLLGTIGLAAQGLIGRSS